MANEAKRIIVYGDVQGVGFRYFVRRAAMQLGITGNVRNCPDSTVEIVAEGEPEKLFDLIAEVQRGPRLARVEHVEVKDIPPRGTYRSFSIEGW